MPTVDGTQALNHTIDVAMNYPNLVWLLLIVLGFVGVLAYCFWISKYNFKASEKRESLLMDFLKSFSPAIENLSNKVQGIDTKLDGVNTRLDNMNERIEDVEDELKTKR